MNDTIEKPKTKVNKIVTIVIIILSAYTAISGIEYLLYRISPDFVTKKDCDEMIVADPIMSPSPQEVCYRRVSTQKSFLDIFLRIDWFAPKKVTPLL